MPLTCQQPVSPCNSVAALPSVCSKTVVMPSDYPTSAFKVRGGGPGGPVCSWGAGLQPRVLALVRHRRGCALAAHSAGFASLCVTPACLTPGPSRPSPCLQADYGVLWERINWLNPTIPFNATTIPKGTTVCVKNGPPPAGIALLPEPGECGQGCCQSCCGCCSWVQELVLRRSHVFCCPQLCVSHSLLLPLPTPAAVPDWLPPWSNVTARNASVYAECAANKPSAGEQQLGGCMACAAPPWCTWCSARPGAASHQPFLHPSLPASSGFVNGTLCFSSNSSGSPVLGAVIGGGLAGACTGVCQYNPAPADGDSDIVAWRFDNDNRCW